MLTISIAFTLILTACSSHIPPEISQPIEGQPSIEMARLKATDYVEKPVRWGGTILHTENKQNTSWITVVAFPLNDYGRPSQSGESLGRFIAIVDEFLEPLVYNTDREVTVSGTLLRTESRKVGDFTYNYPVVKVDHYFLWPPVETYERDYPPFWWYDPWYYPYPYHVHRPR